MSIYLGGSYGRPPSTARALRALRRIHLSITSAERVPSAGTPRELPTGRDLGRDRPIGDGSTEVRS